MRLLCFLLLLACVVSAQVDSTDLRTKHRIPPHHLAQGFSVIPYSLYGRSPVSHSRKDAIPFFGARYSCEMSNGHALRASAEACFEVLQGGDKIKSFASTPDEYEKDFIYSLGYQKRLPFREHLAALFSIDLMAQNIHVLAVYPHTSFSYPASGTYIQYDSTLTFRQSVSSVGLLAGTGLQISTPGRLFVTLEAAAGLSRFRQNGTCITTIHYYNGLTYSGYTRDHEPERLPVSGWAFTLHMLQVGIGIRI